MKSLGKLGFSKIQRYLFLVALFAIVLGLVFYGIFQYNLTQQGKGGEEAGADEEKNLGESATSSVSFLNGLLVPASSATSCAAVMIDNAPEVELQFGVKVADLVYEVPVEGGRTRFMAVYHLTTSTVATIGPVRSARPYFLDWVQELNCLYAHVGGSPDALDKIKTVGINDLNEYYNGNYFWRSKKYVAPHSTFTDIENLTTAFLKKNKSIAEAETKSWLFAKTEIKELQAGEGFFEEKLGDTQVSWVFDQKLKEWKRSEYGQTDKDDSGQIQAKNIVFQYVSAQVLDAEGRLSLQTLGKGKAVILKGSRVIKGTWTKNGARERTRFFGPDTKEIEFNPGVTWVEVVPQF